MSSTTTLPTSALLGDLSGTSYTSTAGYDALGQPTTSGLPAMGGLPAESVTTGLRKSGVAQTLTLASAGSTTALVTGVTYSGTGQLTSRTYGNGVTRAYGWDASTRALTGLSASFVTIESASAQTVFVQKDTLTRDVMGRITRSTNEVPVADGSAADGQVTAECFTYDGFNRLSTAWTVAGSGTATCGTVAPASSATTGWDASTTAYSGQWSYSAGGRITSLVKSAGGSAPVTSTYAYTDAAHPAAVTSVSDGTATDSFTYDAAGRMVSRTVDGVTTALTWDVTSSLTESDGQGGHVVYAYDASGQRVAQARVADADGVGTATAYVASGQVEDPNTATTSTGDVTATRYYTFGGSTVAVRTNDNKLALMLGDEQGSTSVVMPVTVQPGGALAPATLNDAAAVTRTSYTPYGELRGEDNPAVDRGWLGQVEDRVSADGASGTGLTYLNARYYDPATQRFISPDPLMNPGDPKTLDPYRYADNNPVVFTDASGLMPCAGTGAGEARCLEMYHKGTKTTKPTPGKKTTTTYRAPRKSSTSTSTPPRLGPQLTAGSAPEASPLQALWSSTSCLNGPAPAINCASQGADGYSAGNKTAVDGLGASGRYVTPSNAPAWSRSLRRSLFGESGARAVAIGSHLDNIGPAGEGVGAALSYEDSMNHIEDLGASGSMGTLESATYAALRWAMGELGGTVGMVYGAQAGMASGVVCYEAAIVCSPVFATVGAFSFGSTGDALGTYVFDHLLGGDAYLDWRAN